MHHVGSQEISEFDSLERLRNYSSPMLIRDVFEAFISSKVVTLRPGWDNQSDEIHFVDPSLPEEKVSWVDRRKMREPGALPQYQQVAHSSPGACQSACVSLKNCLQWRFFRGVCSVSSTVKMGRPRLKSPEDRLTSGWEVDRIKAWAKANEDCGEVIWPEVVK